MSETNNHPGEHRRISGLDKISTLEKLKSLEKLLEHKSNGDINVSIEGNDHEETDRLTAELDRILGKLLSKQKEVNENAKEEKEEKEEEEEEEAIYVQVNQQNQKIEKEKMDVNKEKDEDGTKEEEIEDEREQEVKDNIFEKFVFEDGSPPHLGEGFNLVSPPDSPMAMLISWGGEQLSDEYHSPRSSDSASPLSDTPSSASPVKVLNESFCTPPKPRSKLILTPSVASSKPFTSSPPAAVTMPTISEIPEVVNNKFGRNLTPNITRNPYGPGDYYGGGEGANIFRSINFRRNSMPVTSTFTSTATSPVSSSFCDSNWLADPFQSVTQKETSAPNESMLKICRYCSFETEVAKDQVKERFVKKSQQKKSLKSLEHDFHYMPDIDSKEALNNKSNQSDFFISQSYWNVNNEQQPKQQQQQPTPSISSLFYSEHQEIETTRDENILGTPRMGLFGAMGSSSASTASNTGPLSTTPLKPFNDLGSYGRASVANNNNTNNNNNNNNELGPMFTTPELNRSTSLLPKDVCSPELLTSGESTFSPTQTPPFSKFSISFTSHSAPISSTSPSTNSNGERFGQIFGLNYFHQMPIHFSTNALPLSLASPSSQNSTPTGAPITNGGTSTNSSGSGTNGGGSTPSSLMPSSSMAITPTVTSINQHFLKELGKDDLEVRAKDQREAASRVSKCETVFSIPNFDFKPPANPVYSTKVFLGGVPWDMDNDDMIEVFRQYGACYVQRPGKDVRLSRASQGLEKAGYLYLLFERAEDVNKLMDACKLEFSEDGHKYFYTLTSKRTKKEKRVQVVPWNTADSVVSTTPHPKMDLSRTVFLGALHGMMNAQSVAEALSNIFGPVEYVSLDTDRYRYPTGSGRGMFASKESYRNAIQTRFLRMKSERFDKTIQIDPFIDDCNCIRCFYAKGPVFCKTCSKYYCKNCWIICHTGEDGSIHTVMMKPRVMGLLKDYLRESPEPLFNKAMFDMMDDGLSVCVPDDPAGNAKLMFSILECLDKSSRNVVTYLMDHIKLIHLNADRNKMTSQALAICFGPLFSCHSETESVYKAIQVFKFLLDIWPPRRGSFNFMKKLDEIKGSSTNDLTTTTSSVSQSKTLEQNRIDRSGYDRSLASSSGFISDYGKSHGGASATSSALYDSPPSSYHRFTSITTSTTNTTPSSSYPARTTVPLSATSTSWNTSSGGAGTGRMLPSTQSATRTISSYSASEKIEVKVPPGSSGPTILSPAAKAARDAAREAAASSSTIDYGYSSTRGSAVPGTAHLYPTTTSATTSSCSTSYNSITGAGGSYRSRYTSDYDHNSTATTAATTTSSSYGQPRSSYYTSDYPTGSALTSSTGGSTDLYNTATTTTRSYLSGTGSDAIYSTVNKPSKSSFIYGSGSGPSPGPIDVDELLYKSTQLDNYFSHKTSGSSTYGSLPYGSAGSDGAAGVSQFSSATSNVSSSPTGGSTTRSSYLSGGGNTITTGYGTDSFTTTNEVKPLIGSNGSGTTTQLYPNKMSNSTTGNNSVVGNTFTGSSGGSGYFNNTAGAASIGRYSSGTNAGAGSALTSVGSSIASGGSSMASSYRSNYLNSTVAEDEDVR